MPKRDDAYMKGQRDALVQAAVKCLLKKGLSETSMQDVAKAAGVSLGSLYVHFTDKYELVLAACRASYGIFGWPRKPCNTWAEYIREADDLKKYLQSDRGRRRTRLSFQIVTELIMNRKNLPGFTEWYEEVTDAVRNDLRILHRKGEISLPLGLHQTVLTHMHLSYGVVYNLFSNHDADIDAIMASLKSALALTAGAAFQTAALRETG